MKALKCRRKKFQGVLKNATLYIPIASGVLAVFWGRAYGIRGETTNTAINILYYLYF